MVVSPADVKIVYRVGFPNQSLTKDSQVLSTFSSMQCTGLQYSLTVHQISLKRIISYKSSLTDALICLPWLSLEDGTTLLLILFLWIKFLNKSAQWHLNFCTQSSTRFSFLKQNSQILQSNWLSAALISALIGRCNRKVRVMRKHNCTRTLECVQSKARESVIKLLVQLIYRFSQG